MFSKEYLSYKFEKLEGPMEEANKELKGLEDSVTKEGLALELENMKTALEELKETLAEITEGEEERGGTPAPADRLLKGEPYYVVDGGKVMTFYNRYKNQTNEHFKYDGATTDKNEAYFLLEKQKAENFVEAYLNLFDLKEAIWGLGEDNFTRYLVEPDYNRVTPVQGDRVKITPQGMGEPFTGVITDIDYQDPLPYRVSFDGEYAHDWVSLDEIAEVIFMPEGEVDYVDYTDER